jgi:mono/diheme cytochrome c family protein
LHSGKSALLALLISGGIIMTSASFAAVPDPLSAADAKTLKSPTPYSKTSIEKGKRLFLQNCTGCHGDDGKAELAVIAEATNLTEPKGYKDGTTEGELFRNIRDGAGSQMPPFKDTLNEQQTWDLVNFVRSLWPDSMRPSLQDQK